MLKLLETGRHDAEVTVRVEGYLTWSTAWILRRTCEAYAGQGVRRVALVADQLRGLDLPAVQVLDGLSFRGLRLSFHGAGGFVRAQLADCGHGEWIAQAQGSDREGPT